MDADQTDIPGTDPCPDPIPCPDLSDLLTGEAVYTQTDLTVSPDAWLAALLGAVAGFLLCAVITGRRS
jgi:hypothetical protein